MEKTIFQKIIDREIPATIEHEDDHVIAIRDLHPNAPVHLLIIPKKVIPSVNDVTEADKELIGHMTIVAQQLAKKFGVAESGYRLTTNVNADGGQTVFHLHMHLLGGEPLGKMNTGTTGGHTPKSAPSSGTLWEAGIMVIAAIGLAIGFNAMNPKGITWIKKEFEKIPATNDDLADYLPAAPTDASAPKPETSTDKTVDTEEPSKQEQPKEEDTSDDASAVTSSDSPEVEVPKETAEPAKTEFVAQPGVVREINITQFKALMAGDHYLIDARTPEAYAKGHIGDAVNFFGGEAEAQIGEMLAQVPQDKVIMIYCDGGEECELSHHIADVLKQFGYGPMFIYMGGWNEWNAQ